MGGGEDFSKQHKKSQTERCDWLFCIWGCRLTAENHLISRISHLIFLTLGVYVPNSNLNNELYDRNWSCVRS